MKKILTSIWFLSLILSIPVIFLIPPLFNKYEIRQIEKYDVYEKNSTGLYYVDLNGDNVPERIVTFIQQSDNQFSFQYFDQNGGMIEQVNWPIKYHMDINNLFFADVNHDNQKEVYHYAFENDSLVLYWLQLTPKITPFNSIPICKINTYNDSLLDYSLFSIQSVALENNGKSELLLDVIGGYSVTPRQIFKVDLATRKIMASENTGCANSRLKFDDLDGDGIFEVIADGEVAPIRDTFKLPYNVGVPFLKVLKSDLSYFFPPVRFFEGIQSSTTTFVVNDGDEKELLCTFLSSSAECVPFRAYKINLKGEKIDSLVYNTHTRLKGKYVFRMQDGHFFTQIEPSVLLEYTDDLKIVKTIPLNITGDLQFHTICDLNYDGIEEVLFLNHDATVLHIFSDKFKKHLFIKNGNTIFGRSTPFISNGKFYITTNESFLGFEFKKNPLFYLRFPFYIVIYFFIFLLIFLLQKMIESRLQERYKLQNQVHELQLKTLRNQLDPHFVYNTFNTIASVIKQGRNDEAYNLFVKLSKMIRSNLDASNEIYTTLEKELTFVKDYLTIQKFRFKDLFEFKIEADEKVNQNLKIPKMVIQIHVENALKHGIRNKGASGLLLVRVINKSQFVKIEIEDNGVGRKQSKFYNTESTGIGLNAIRQIIDLNNQRESNKISQKIIDLKDESNNSLGTRVELIINFGEKKFSIR